MPPAWTNSALTRESAFAHILPYLEQSSAFDLWHRDPNNSNIFLPATDPLNVPIVSQRISAFLCPTCNFARQVPISACDSDRAPGTYAFCTGSDDPWGSVPHNGAIVYYNVDNATTTATRFSSILDGTTNTFLSGESHWGFIDYTFTSGPCIGQVRGGFSYWSSPYPLATNFSTRGPFNPQSMNGDSTRLSNFRSSHPGGVNMGLCDGSVRFYQQSISSNILNAMATRRGGEVVNQ
jgi:prepilin-type processing-associated H-X9-DG protein